MSRSIVAVVALASLMLFVDSAKAGEYTYLQYARGEMKNTCQVLESIKRPYHGHREPAIKALKAAMTEVDAALKSVGIAIYYEAPSIQATGFDRLPGSLKVIREAREKLSNAGKGFAHHRVQAIKALDVVISELEAALDQRPQPSKAGKAGKKRASKK